MRRWKAETKKDLSPQPLRAPPPRPRDHGTRSPGLLQSGRYQERATNQGALASLQQKAAPAAASRKGPEPSLVLLSVA